MCVRFGYDISLNENTTRVVSPVHTTGTIHKNCLELPFF